MSKFKVGDVVKLTEKHRRENIDYVRANADSYSKEYVSMVVDDTPATVTKVSSGGVCANHDFWLYNASIRPVESPADVLTVDDGLIPADDESEGDKRRHNHYFKKCGYDYVDVYRVIQMFEVSDPCLQHAVKKLLVTGNRGFKDIAHDVQDAIDTLERWKEMQSEELARSNTEGDNNEN